MASHGLTKDTLLSLCCTSTRFAILAWLVWALSYYSLEILDVTFTLSAK